MEILLDATQAVKQCDSNGPAVEAAKRMAGNPKPYRVTPRHRCPVCEHGQWCLHDQVSGVTLCTRKSEGALLNRDSRPIQFGSFGFLHTHGVNSLYIGGFPGRSSWPARPAKQRSTPSDVLRQVANAYAGAAQATLPMAAAELGLPVEVLGDFGFGFNAQFWFADSGRRAPAWTWPDGTRRAKSAESAAVGWGAERRGFELAVGGASSCPQRTQQTTAN